MEPAQPANATSGKPQQIRNSAIYLLPVAIGNLVPLATLPIFTRLLSQEDFGAWALANAYATVVGGLATAGLPIAYDRNFFEHRLEPARSQLLFSVIAFAAVTFAIVVAGSWLMQETIARWVIGDTSYRSLIAWSTAATAIVALKAFFMTALKNSERAAEFSAYTIAERLLAAVATVALVAWARWGALGLVAGQLVASAAVLAVIAFRFLPTGAPGLSRALLRDALKLGYPLMPRILLSVIGNNVDKYLIGQVTSLGGVGVYTVGQRVANIAFTYMTALQNVFGPQVYARMFSGDPGAGKAIGRYLTPFAYASTLLAFLVATFSDEILRVLTPPAFYGAVPIVGILTLYFSVQFFGKMPQITFARKTHLISMLAAISIVVTATLTALGIWLLGAVGAAWGTLAAGLIMATTAFVIGQRCFRIEWEARKQVAMFSLLFASAFAVLALRAAAVPYPVLLGVKLLALLAFLRLGAHLRILTRENARVVLSLIAGRRARAAELH